MGSQRAGMGSGENEMPVIGNQALLCPGISAPEYEYHRIFPIIEQPDNPVGEDFPALAPVGIGLAPSYRKHRIEQQNPVVCPAFQAAVGRRVDPQIILQLLKNIDQRRRCLYSFLHRKTKAVSLSRLMIRILP